MYSQTFIRTVFILPLSVFCFPSQKLLQGDLDKSPYDSKFDHLVHETLYRLHVPGLSIAVIDGNQTFTKVLPVFPYAPPFS